VYESISYQYNDTIIRLLNESGRSWTITIVGKILLQHFSENKENGIHMPLS